MKIANFQSDTCAGMCGDHSVYKCFEKDKNNMVVEWESERNVNATMLNCLEFPKRQLKLTYISVLETPLRSQITSMINYWSQCVHLRVEGGMITLLC